MKPALSPLEAQLLPKKISATGLRVERFSLYVEADNYLLNPNSTDKIIALVVKGLEPYNQA